MDSGCESKKGDFIMTDFELARQIAKEIQEKHREAVLPFILEEGEAGLCDSKASGTPYLPHDMSWPLDGANQPMELLAQIDCSALESLPDFPHTGLLQFFIGTDECYGADFDDMTNQKGFCVLYHEMVDVSVTEEEVLEKRPKKSDEEDVCTPFETEKPCRIRFAASKSMGLTEGNFHFDGLFVEEWNRCHPDAPIEKTSEIHQRLKKEDLDYGWDVFDIKEECEDGEDDDEPVRHQMGGYPHFTQYDPRSNDKMSALDVMLFQLDSDFRPKNREYLVCWGDAGIANFFISREALKKRDFTKVAYTWD